MLTARTSRWLAAVIGTAALVCAATGAEARDGRWKHGPRGHWYAEHFVVAPGPVRFFGPGPVVYAAPPVAFVSSYPVYAAPVYARPVYAPVYAGPVYTAGVAAASVTAAPVRTASVDAAPAYSGSPNMCTEFALPPP